MKITTMSSTEFSRNSNEVKKAAMNGPVFITDRGKPAHVLLTIERQCLSSSRFILEYLLDTAIVRSMTIVTLRQSHQSVVLIMLILARVVRIDSALALYLA
jgi:prevent-host-death family protein